MAEGFQPSLDDLLDTMPNKFNLVMVLSRRGRHINEAIEGLVDLEHRKPISVAMDELLADRISYTLPEEQQG